MSGFRKNPVFEYFKEKPPTTNMQDFDTIATYKRSVETFGSRRMFIDTDVIKFVLPLYAK